MALSSSVLRWAFGKEDAPAALSLALFARGKEVATAGYKRAEVKKGEWRVTGTSASAVVRFGPFAQPLAFDRVVVAAGSSIVEELVVGETTVPAGTVYEFEPFVTLGE